MDIERDDQGTQGILGRLTRLERENRSLLAEVEALRRASTIQPRVHGSASARFGRRSALRRAVGLAAGAAALGAFMTQKREPAEATTIDVLDYVQVKTLHVTPEPGTYGFYSSSTLSGYPAFKAVHQAEDSAVHGTTNGSVAAIEGVSTGLAGIGVKGTSRVGVQGESSSSGYFGVFGRNLNGNGIGVRGVGGSIGVKGEGSAGVFGSSSTAGYEGVYGQHTGFGFGVVGDGNGAQMAGVLGRNSTGPGIRGEGQVGVEGTSTSTGSAGVYGEHNDDGFGVIGKSHRPGRAGVLGQNEEGEGVLGVGLAGVRGTSATTGYEGVYGQHTGLGFGVVGDGAGPEMAGVLGRNKTGDGIRGEGLVGVHGKSSQKDLSAVRGEGSGGASGVVGSSVAAYGGVFQGGKAQLKLLPAPTAGKPATGAHVKGEIYMDSKAALFVCTVAGTPGTWRRVALV